MGKILERYIISKSVQTIKKRLSLKDNAVNFAIIKSTFCFYAEKGPFINYMRICNSLNDKDDIYNIVIC